VGRTLGGRGSHLNPEDWPALKKASLI
jgi:hypothetical protein